MATILTINKLQSIKPMSKNNLQSIGQLIGEVEFCKIQKLLGTQIYNDILEEVNSGTISPELNQILEGGLYKCITYFVYSRYIQESMLVDTFTGVVVKQRQDAQTAPMGQIKNVVNEYVDMAMMAYELVRDQIVKRYGKPEETVETGFSEIIGIRRDNERKNVKYCSNYF